MLGAGDVVGKFKLVQPLGDGATARVWLAHSVKDRADQVAVKLIRPTQVEGNVERFAREADLLWRLDHPHIVRLRTSGALLEQGLLYLVMDLVDGEPLDARLARGPMSAEASRTLFAGLGDALRYAHGRGTFHRDLKPHNVMVRPDGAAVLIDFGIALDAQRGRPSLTGDGLVAGTVAYMAPEVFRAGVRPDPALGDVYAMGLMLYEALTGRRAFPVPDGLNEQQAVARVIADKARYDALDPGEPAPADLRALVKLATEPHPELRLASMARMAERLGAPPVSASPGRASGRGDSAAGESGTRWLDEDDDPFGDPSDDPASEGGSWKPPVLPPKAGMGAARAADGDGARGAAVASEASPPPASPPRFQPPRRAEPSSRSDGATVLASAPAAPRGAPGADARARPTSAPRAADAPIASSPSPTPLAPRSAEAPAARGAAQVTPPTGADPAISSTPAPMASPMAPATEAAPASGGPSTWWMLVAAAALAAVVLVTLAGTALWWILASPSAPAEPLLVGASAGAREVRFAVTDGDRLWVDGVEVPVVAGVAASAWAPGPHAVVSARGEGCVGSPPVSGACCARAEADVQVLAGEGPQDATAPAAPPLTRDLHVSVVTAGAAPASRPDVWVDGEAVGVAGDGWIRLGLGLGEHRVRVDAGACPAEAVGCAGGLATDGGAPAAGTCPAGCASWEGAATVSCGEGPQALALRLAVPAPTESVDAAVAAVVGDSPAVKAPPTARPARPTKEFAVQEAPKEAPRPITVRIGVVGISGDKLLDGAVSQAAVQRQTSMLEGCYRSWLRGSAALPKAVTVSFKADKAGLVEQASVRAVSSSGESALDTCAINTVRRSTMTGAKKAAEGRVKIQFESYQ